MQINRFSVVRYYNHSFAKIISNTLDTYLVFKMIKYCCNNNSYFTLNREGLRPLE